MSEKNNSIKELLNNIDVLIDGKFKIEELSLDLYYRGSRNQRVINVKESLKQNQVILIEKFMKDKQIKNLVEKKKYVFV
jgi:anaerobic ribonucleoside-triphosphate reductase activating protein